MADKIFLITGFELAQHTTEKQLELVNLLTQAHESYPDADIASLLTYAKDWVATHDNTEENWDYAGDHTKSAYEPVATDFIPLPEEENLVDLEEEVNEIPVVEEEVVEETPSYELDEPVYELEPPVYEPVYELEPPVYEEEAVEEHATYEPKPLPPAPNFSTETDEVDEEDEDEVGVVPEEEDDYFANSPVVSRQRKWRGLLSEAGKLDR